MSPKIEAVTLVGLSTASASRGMSSHEEAATAARCREFCGVASSQHAGKISQRRPVPACRSCVNKTAMLHHDACRIGNPFQASQV